MSSSEALKRAKKKYYEKNKENWKVIREKKKNASPEEKMIENLKEIIKNLLPNA